MRRKKIVVYSFTFLPNLGGLERNSFTLCNTLTSLGHEVTLLTKTPNSNTDDESYNFEVVRSTSFLTFLKVIASCELVIMNGGITKPIAFISLVLKKKYMPLYANAELNFLKGSELSDKFSRFLFHNAFYHICLSEYTRKQTDKANSVVVLNPIDTELELINKDYNSISILQYDCLFVGRIIKGKGVYVLAEAIKLIKQKHGISISVAFAGEGDATSELKEKLAEDHINFKMLGRINGERLIDAYKSSRLVIIPSTTHVEGNPLVLAEAISCGTPVIVSDQQAMVETIEDAGLYFKNGDSTELSEKIYSLLSDNLAYEKVKKNTEYVKDKFSMKNYARNLQDLLLK